MTASAKAKKSRARGAASGEVTGEQNTFRTPGAACYLGVGESTLRLWRENGDFATLKWPRFDHYIWPHP